MIQISEASAIALHSVVYISIKDFASLKDIADRFDVSSNHLSKVLQTLVKAGYLTSSKGPAGGFRIAEGKENTSSEMSRGISQTVLRLLSERQRRPLPPLPG